MSAGEEAEVASEAICEMIHPATPTLWIQVSYAACLYFGWLRITGAIRYEPLLVAYPDEVWGMPC